MTEQIRLRGEHWTGDPRLDRLPTWDERSENFRVLTALMPEQIKKPRSFTWKIPIRRNQGQEGRCVEFGICHELAARPKVVDPGKVDGILFNRSIYWPAQQRDEWEGGSYPGASPFYEGTSVHAGMAVATELGYYKEYRWALEIDEFALGIAYQGPGVVGVDWYRGMYDPDSSDGGLVHLSGSVVGGHCFCIPRVDIRRRRFGCINSWGEDWGLRDAYSLGGYFEISFDDMDKLLHDGGEFCIPAGRHL